MGSEVWYQTVVWVVLSLMYVAGWMFLMVTMATVRDRVDECYTGLQESINSMYKHQLAMGKLLDSIDESTGGIKNADRLVARATVRGVDSGSDLEAARKKVAAEYATRMAAVKINNGKGEEEVGSDGEEMDPE